MGFTTGDTKNQLPFTRKVAAAVAAVVVGCGVAGGVILDPPVYIGTEVAPPVSVSHGSSSSSGIYPNVLTETSTANVWVSATGSDSGSACTYSSSPVSAPTAANACASFDKADSLAQGGGANKTVGVLPGTYPATTANYGYTTNILNHGTNPVTFECQTGAAADSATFSDPGFLFYGAQQVTMLGSCFHFHIPAIGLRGYSPSPACNSINGTPSTGPIIFNGVHMDSFDVAGSCNVTIENSQVGPIISCYTQGQDGGVGECPTSGALASVTSYWNGINATSGCSSGTNGFQAEPFIHSNGPAASGTVLNNDLFYGSHFGNSTKKTPAIMSICEIESALKYNEIDSLKAVEVIRERVAQLEALRDAFVGSVAQAA